MVGKIKYHRYSRNIAANFSNVRSTPPILTKRTLFVTGWRPCGCPDRSAVIQAGVRQQMSKDAIHLSFIGFIIITQSISISNQLVYISNY